MLKNTKKTLIGIIVALLAAVFLCVGVSLLAPKPQTAYAAETEATGQFKVFCNYDDVGDEDYNTLKDAWERACERSASVNNNEVFVEMYADAEISSTLVVESKYIDLILKGHRISYTGASGPVISVNGGTFVLESGSDKSTTHTVDNPTTDATADTVEIAGGVITGGKGDNGGCVKVESGTFTFRSGTIAGNTATGNGGGVYVSGFGNFKMYKDAAIKYNAAQGQGGGVYSDGTFEIRDAVNVSGNIGGTGASAKADNVYLPQAKKLTFWSPFTEGAQIGVTLESGYTGAFTLGYGERNTAGGKVVPPQTYIISDDESYVPALNGDGEVELVAAAASVTAGGVKRAYADFTEAWAAANEAGTAIITMLADATTDETLVVDTGKIITLEMKKHKIEFTGESGSVIQVNGTFTVQQGSTDGVSAEHKITDPVTEKEVTVYNSLITGGKGSGDNKLGGGVFVAEGGKFTLGYYVAVAGNTGGYGGGVRVNENATFIMNESAEITYNKATYDGGGLCVCNAASVTLNCGEISQNAAAAGGGIYFEGGSADYTVKGTSVVNNVVTANGAYGGRGGGIYIDGSSVLLDTGRMDEYGPVRANTATVCGGGVFVSENGKLKVHGSVYIADNTKDGQNNNVYLDGSAKIEVSEAFRYLNIYVNNTGDVATGFFSEDLPSRVFKSDDEANNCVWISDEATGTVHIGHIGGTATCQTKATCEKCNKEYGELGAHNYDADHLCTVCGETEKIYWGISDGKLLISGVSGTVATNSFDYDAVFGYYDSAPWYNARASITSVEFDGENGVAPVSLKYWFNGCSELTNIDLSGLNTSNVTDMFSMFGGCTKLASLDLSGFDTTKVTDMSDMFFQCSALTSLDLSAFDFTNVTNMRCMFRNCTVLNEIVFPTEVNAQKVTAVDYMFENCKGMTSVDLSAFKTKELTNMSRMFLGCSILTSVTFSASFDTAKVTNMSQLFQSCTALTSPGISGFNTESVTTMENFFGDCAGLTSLDLTNLNMQNVTKMRSMFNGCTNLTDITFPTVFNTAKVTDMAFLFSRCGALKKIDLSSFNTESLTVMEGMFYTCGELQEVNLSSFDAQNVTNANYMFYGCNALNKVIAPAKIGESFSTALPSVKFWNGAADVTYIDNTGAGKTFVKHAGHTGGTATCQAKATCEICGQEYGELGTHSLTTVAQKNATCTEAGVLAHDHCSVCGKDFIENVEKSAEQLAIAKTAHEWEAEFTVDKAATCTEKGSKSKHCSHCGEKSEVTEIAAKGHHLAHHAAVEANTEAAGNTEYWSCAECDKYFSDSEGTTEIADKSSVVIPKLPEPTPEPAPAAKGKPLNALWITLIVILSVVIVGEVGYIVYRQVRKNKATEDEE